MAAHVCLALCSDTGHGSDVYFVEKADFVTGSADEIDHLRIYTLAPLDADVRRAPPVKKATGTLSR